MDVCFKVEYENEWIISREMTVYQLAPAKALIGRINERQGNRCLEY